MMIDFKALEQALAPIEEIGQGELTFDAGTTPVTLRVLLPSEEVEAQKYAATAINEADQGEHSAIDYLDRFRIGCLSHSVVAVGGVNFRGQEFVETGDKLDNGNTVKIPKHKAMRMLLARWTRPTLTAVFGRFNELVSKAEAEAEKLIEYEPSNIPAEMDRLQKRMAELRAELENAEAAEKVRFSDKVASLAESETDTHAASAPVQPPHVPAVDPEQLITPAVARRTGPITPTHVAPPAERADAPTAAAPAPAAANERRQPARPDSSFIDTDSDELDAAVDAEHRRIAERRRRAAQGAAPMDEGSALNTVHPQVVRQRPPHADAAQVESEVGVVAARHHAVQGHEDVPVLDLGAQELGSPLPQQPDKPPAHTINPAVNPEVPANPSANPRFTPRPKP